MSEPPEEKPAGGRPADKPNSGGARWGVWIVVALVLYVVSIGPAAKLMQAGTISSGFYQRAYAPIGWITWPNEIAERALWWYFDLWGVNTDPFDAYTPYPY